MVEDGLNHRITDRRHHARLEAGGEKPFDFLLPPRSVQKTTKLLFALLP
jgi:hypothetical protein